MTSYSDHECWNAIQQLLIILPDILSKDEALALYHQLIGVINGEGTTDLSEKVMLAMGFIYEVPEAQERLNKILSEIHKVEESYKMNLPPGGSNPIPPGKLLLCPQQPEHYQIYQLYDGQEIYCPQHGCKLIPALL